MTGKGAATSARVLAELRERVRLLLDAGVTDAALAEALIVLLVLAGRLDRGLLAPSVAAWKGVA